MNSTKLAIAGTHNQLMHLHVMGEKGFALKLISTRSIFWNGWLLSSEVPLYYLSNANADGT